jgi:hypothetical protein
VGLRVCLAANGREIISSAQAAKSENMEEQAKFVGQESYHGTDVHKTHAGGFDHEIQNYPGLNSTSFTYRLWSKITKRTRASIEPSQQK